MAEKRVKDHSPPARADTLLMGLGVPVGTGAVVGAVGVNRPKFRHASAFVDLKSEKITDVSDFLGRVFALDPYSESLWPRFTEEKTRIWLNALIRSSHWRWRQKSYCVITYDTEGDESGAIKAASLWNVKTNPMTYALAFVDCFCQFGLLETLRFLGVIIFTMNWDFRDLYRDMHTWLRRETPRAPIYHLDFIGADPAHQGQGYGSSCIRFGISAAEAGGASLAMISSNTRNIPFYVRNGFQPLSTKVSAGVRLTAMVRPLADKIRILLTQGKDK